MNIPWLFILEGGEGGFPDIGMDWQTCQKNFTLGRKIEMERIEKVNNVVMYVKNKDNEVLKTEREKFDMRRFIDLYRQKDFKLRQLCSIFEHGFSFGCNALTFKDGSIYF